MLFPDFIEKLPQADFPVPGVQCWLLQAPKHQVAFLKTEVDMMMPEHFHGAQWEIPIEGSAEIIISGETKVYGPAQPFFVPAWVPHAGKVKGPYAAIIIWDSPDRHKVKK